MTGVRHSPVGLIADLPRSDSEEALRAAVGESEDGVILLCVREGCRKSARVLQTLSELEEQPSSAVINSASRGPLSHRLMRLVVGSEDDDAMRLSNDLGVDRSRMPHVFIW